MLTLRFASCRCSGPLAASWVEPQETKVGRMEKSEHLHTHSHPNLVYCHSLPLDDILAEAEFFPQHDSYRVDPRERILFQAPVLTGCETLFPPLVPDSWGDNGFCSYYPGGLSIPHCFPQPHPPSVNSQLNNPPSGESLWHVFYPLLRNLNNKTINCEP